MVQVIVIILVIFAIVRAANKKGAQARRPPAGGMGQGRSPHGEAPPMPQNKTAPYSQPLQSGRPENNRRAPSYWQTETRDPWELPPEKDPWD